MAPTLEKRLAVPTEAKPELGMPLLAENLSNTLRVLSSIPMKKK